MSETTRRSLIQTSALSALGAGLMALAPTTTAQAAPAERVTVVNTDDLAGESRRRFEDYQAARALAKKRSDALQAVLTPDQWKLAIDLSDAQGLVHMEEENMHLAELARHLPPIAGLLRMLGEHVIMGRLLTIGACCTVAEGFEP